MRFFNMKKERKEIISTPVNGEVLDYFGALHVKYPDGDNYEWKLKKPKPQVFTADGGMGDQVTFTSENNGLTAGMYIDLYGWKTPMPEVGDLLTKNMASGRSILLEFTEINRMGDPADMFSGKARLIWFTDCITNMEILQ